MLPFISSSLVVPTGFCWATLLCLPVRPDSDGVSQRESGDGSGCGTLFSDGTVASRKLPRRTRHIRTQTPHVSRRRLPPSFLPLYGCTYSYPHTHACIDACPNICTRTHQERRRSEPARREESERGFSPTFLCVALRACIILALF